MEFTTEDTTVPDDEVTLTTAETETIDVTSSLELLETTISPFLTNLNDQTSSGPNLNDQTSSGPNLNDQTSVTSSGVQTTSQTVLSSGILNIQTTTSLQSSSTGVLTSTNEGTCI